MKAIVKEVSPAKGKRIIAISDIHGNLDLFQRLWTVTLAGALQQAAIELSRELGCYQMRSWSSLNKVANYAVKFQLSFAFCPGTFTVLSTGEQIPGGWFVKRL